MKRLTVKHNGTYEIKDIEDIPCGDVCERNYGCETCKIHKAVEKLAEYEDAEEQRLLLRLPCKVGDIVYCTWTTLDKNGKLKREIVEESFKLEMLMDVGYAVFITREEAEQALARMEKENG